MAQDPGLEEEDGGRVDPSPDLDLVTLFSSSTTEAEFEANNIQEAERLLREARAAGPAAAAEAEAASEEGQ